MVVGERPLGRQRAPLSTRLTLVAGTSFLVCREVPVPIGRSRGGIDDIELVGLVGEVGVRAVDDDQVDQILLDIDGRADEIAARCHFGGARTDRDRSEPLPCRWVRVDTGAHIRPLKELRRRFRRLHPRVYGRGLRVGSE